MVQLTDVIAAFGQDLIRRYFAYSISLIFADKIVSSFFFDDNLNIFEIVRKQHRSDVDIIENDDQYSGDQLFFQQDGASLHLTQLIRRYLHERFPMQWIERKSFIECPARLSDLSSLDFFSWAHFKTNI